MALSTSAYGWPMVAYPKVNFLTTPTWIGYRRWPSWSFCFAASKAGSMFRGWSTTSSVVYTVSDVVSGSIDIMGWKVILSGSGEEIGEVKEIVQIERFRKNSNISDGEVYQYLLKAGDFVERDNQVEYLIPLVEAIVREVNARFRCLVIKPPNGLLDLARRPEVLRRLRVSLIDFLMKMHGNSPSQDLEFRSLWMPTRRKLLAAGRKDLVDEIMTGGGFLYVAHALNLRARRRPDGFWEDLRNLDTEIEQFVKQSLVPKYSNSGSPNQLQKTRVMPRRRSVMEARRWDIHHAIVLHGGYKTVARELHRKTVPDVSLSDLIQNIHKFMEDKGLSKYPTSQDLRMGNRQDMIHSIRNHGGFKALAKHLGYNVVEIDCKHSRWKDISSGAAAIKSYMCAKLMEGKLQPMTNVEEIWAVYVNGGFLKLPTQAEVERDGRNDLRYVLRKFGHIKLARYLNVSIPSSRGRKRLID